VFCTPLYIKIDREGLGGRGLKIENSLAMSSHGNEERAKGKEER